MILICKHCGKEYEYEFNRKTINWKASYCSKKCTHAAKQKAKEESKILKKHVCSYCDKEYFVKTFLGNWRKNNIQKTGKGGVDCNAFCSFECGMKYRNDQKIKTCLEKYGVKNAFQKKEIREKALKGTKSKNCVEKRKKTCLKKYGYENPSQDENIKKKKEQTCFKHYGVSSSFKLKRVHVLSHTKEAKRKEYLTKKKNNSFNSSKLEIKIKDLLLQKFSDTKHQYRSEIYPWNCDFYIPSKNLYIEIQGSWVHGYRPYKGTIEDLKIVERWREKAKNSNYYKQAVFVWTNRDPLKRQTAKDNNLNWIEFFSLNEFLDWYNKEI